MIILDFGLTYKYDDGGVNVENREIYCSPSEFVRQK